MYVPEYVLNEKQFRTVLSCGILYSTHIYTLSCFLAFQRTLTIILYNFFSVCVSAVVPRVKKFSFNEKSNEKYFKCRSQPNFLPHTDL